MSKKPILHAYAPALCASALCLLMESAQATRYPAHPINPNATLTPTAWTLSRFAPRRWTTAPQALGRVDVLTIGLDALDGPLVRPPPFNTNFYNIQAREITFPTLQAAGTTVAGSLYIPASWNNSLPASISLNRRSEMLLQLTPLANDGDCPAGGSDCFYYGAIGFSNAQVADQLAGGGVPRIRILKKGVDDGWINLTTPFLSDAWNDVCVNFTGTTLQYYLNGSLIFTDDTLVATDPTAGPPTRFRSTTMESYNFGFSFDSQWADLEYGTQASLSLTRTPATQVAPVTGIYSIINTVRNTGSTGASSVQVLETELTGMSLVSVSGACAAFPCNLGTLAPGDVRTFSSNYQVNTAATTVRSTAFVRTDNVDCDKSNNQVTVASGVGTLVAAPALNNFGMLALLLSMLGLAAYAHRRRD